MTILPNLAARPAWKRAVIAACVAVAVLAAPIGGWAGYLRLTGNIHEVEPGLIYRSGQLSAGQLSELLRAKHIRAVLNLRGEHRGRSWYDDEMTITAQESVAHIDLRLSATHEPQGDLVATLLDVLRTAPKPLLIHCEGGADRTGLASALYQVKIAGKPYAVAAEQLSFRYGHFPWLFSRSGAMDQAFSRVVAVSSSGSTPN